MSALARTGVAARYGSWLLVIRIPACVTGTGAVGAADLLTAAPGDAGAAVRAGAGDAEGLGAAADAAALAFS
ncbi:MULTISPECIES: hypothetical protein [Streptomyces]|uniref:hypothetical protein n=1 Tax=Streptomyces TaxID=1883 RepID=UPI0004CD7137|nr:hypothetical protein [Streptomyces durhamensis]